MYTPTTPRTPARTGGAGNGSFKNLKTTPINTPATKLKINSFNEIHRLISCCKVIL